MRTLVLAAAFAIAAPSIALAGPTPLEQLGMHVGDTHTNGSSEIVTDRNGTHPEGYVGQAPINQAAADTIPPHRHHHRHHHTEAQKP